jgi:transposase
MDKKLKISGLRADEIILHPNTYYSTSDKQEIIEEFLLGGYSKQAIWTKYTGQEAEHGCLLRWMRELGYEKGVIPKKSNFAFMKTKKVIDTSTDELEMLQLKKRISDLEVKLKEAEMKAIAYSTMMDIAEKEFKISIRKKYNTKP